MSTEHNFSVGSAQYQFLENDLKRVNRSVTPWIIFSGHRSVYIDSRYCCGKGEGDDCTTCSAGTDVAVMQDLQENIEPLLFTYQVNLYFAGHFHNIERQAAVYQGRIVQNAEPVYSEELESDVYLHENPQATVYMVIGSAGNGPDFTNMVYTWSEKYWDNLFGYAVVTILNSTHLYWQTINSATDEAIDKVLLTQNFSPWALPTDDDDDDKNSNGHNSNNNNDDDASSGWTSLSVGEQAAVIICSVLGGLLLVAAVSYFVALKWTTFSSSLASKATATAAAGGQSASEATHVTNPVHAAAAKAAADIEAAPQVDL